MRSSENRQGILWNSKADWQGSSRTLAKCGKNLLESEGLDFQTYTELYNADPATAKAHLKTAMKHVAASVKRGRPSKGTASHRERQHGMASDSRAKLDALHEKAKKGGLSSSDEEDVISALFPDLL